MFENLKLRNVGVLKYDSEQILHCIKHVCMDIAGFILILQCKIKMKPAMPTLKNRSPPEVAA